MRQSQDPVFAMQIDQDIHCGLLLYGENLKITATMHTQSYPMIFIQLMIY